MSSRAAVARKCEELARRPNGRGHRPYSGRLAAEMAEVVGVPVRILEDLVGVLADTPAANVSGGPRAKWIRQRGYVDANRPPSKLSVLSALVGWDRVACPVEGDLVSSEALCVDIDIRSTSTSTVPERLRALVEALGEPELIWESGSGAWAMWYLLERMRYDETRDLLGRLVPLSPGYLEVGDMVRLPLGTRSSPLDPTRLLRLDGDPVVAEGPLARATELLMLHATIDAPDGGSISALSPATSPRPKPRRSPRPSKPRRPTTRSWRPSSRSTLSSQRETTTSSCGKQRRGWGS